MGSSAVADREAMLAALAQIETLTAQMNRLSIDALPSNSWRPGISVRAAEIGWRMLHVFPLAEVAGFLGQRIGAH